MVLAQACARRLVVCCGKGNARTCVYLNLVTKELNAHMLSASDCLTCPSDVSRFRECPSAHYKHHNT